MKGWSERHTAQKSAITSCQPSSLTSGATAALLLSLLLSLLGWDAGGRARLSTRALLLCRGSTTQFSTTNPITNAATATERNATLHPSMPKGLYPAIFVAYNAPNMPPSAPAGKIHVLVNTCTQASYISYCKQHADTTNALYQLVTGSSLDRYLWYTMCRRLSHGRCLSSSQLPDSESWE